jgi:uncharacterized protein YbbK (DUF523 family)
MHPSGFDWMRPARATVEDPLRVIFSACLLGHATGWEGTAYEESLAIRLSQLPNVKPFHFCPENATLGTPRPLTTLYDGDGRAARAGSARVLETTGRDVTTELLRGAEAMLEIARRANVELAVMLDVSDSCGSHAVYIGPPEDRRYQQGFGVAAATLLEAGIPVLAQRDFATLQRLIAALDPTFRADPGAFDFVDGPWFRDYFAEGPIGLKLADYERERAKKPG